MDSQAVPTAPGGGFENEARAAMYTGLIGPGLFIKSVHTSKGRSLGWVTLSGCHAGAVWTDCDEVRSGGCPERLSAAERAVTPGMTLSPDPLSGGAAPTDRCRVGEGEGKGGKNSRHAVTPSMVGAEASARRVEGPTNHSPLDRSIPVFARCGCGTEMTSSRRIRSHR